MEKRLGVFLLIFLSFALVGGVVSASVSVQINSPNEGDWLGSKLDSFSYSASTDADNLDQCWFNLNSGEDVTINCGDTIYNFTESLGNGNYNLRLSANDTGSRSDWTDIDFSIDTILPVISITSLSEEDKLADDIIDLKYNLVEGNLDKCWYSVNGDFSEEMSCSDGFVNVELDQGDNEVIVYVRDLAGNQDSNDVNVFVDSIAPEITINNPLESPIYLSQDYFNVETNIIEDYADTVEFSVSSETTITERGPYTNNTPKIFRYPSAGSVGNGIYTYRITANDSIIGHTSSKEGIVYLDTTAPTISIDSPENNSFVSGTIEIQTTADDGEGSGIDEDGVLIELINESINEEISGSFDSTAFADGSYTIRASAEDKAENEGENFTNIIIDNTKPEIADLQITPNPTMQGQVNISITLVEENLNYSVEPVIEINELVSDYEFTNTGFANNQWNGTLTIKDDNEEVLADIVVNGFTDLAGNIMDENSEYNIQVDTLEPYVLEVQDFSPLKISPKNEDGFLDEVNVDLKFSESSNAVIYIENPEEEVIREIYSTESVENPQNKVWDGKDEEGYYVADGFYFIKVNLTDEIGNTNNSILIGAVEVDNTAPVIGEVAQIATPTNDSTPEYVFNSTEKWKCSLF